MTNPGIYRLFVYGSLRSGFRSPAYEYISRFFHFIGEAKVRGKLFDMGAYPAGIPGEEGFITGELYAINEVHEFGWAVGQLDDYEGVTVEPDEMQLYRRAITEVYIGDGSVHAWVYWYNGSTMGKTEITSGDLAQYLQQTK